MQRSIIEACENRTLLTVFIVDTLADGPTGPADGKLSLREAIVAANNNVAVGDAPAGSASGDVIRFSSALANKKIVLTAGQIGISDDLVIDGQTRNVTISGNNASRIFIVSMNQPLAISNVKLANGLSLGSGGAMFLSGGGSTQLIGVSIVDSVARGASATQGGGAIYNLDQDLTILSSTLERNVANGAAGSGGAIFTASGDVEIKNSTLRQNVANRAGGGVEITVGSLLLDNTRLLGNRAGTGATPAPGNGGGVHVTGAANTRVQNNSLVQNNRAASEGGGLWNSATGTMTVTNSKVDANRASGVAADNGGGGIFNDGGTLVVAGTEVDDNVADGVAGSGGGIFSVAGTITVTDSLVTDNQANRAGGGVEIITGNLTLDGVNLSGNIASTGPGNGGGLHVTATNAVVLIVDSFVRNNVAGNEGGGLWNAGGASAMTVRNTLIESNASFGTGGGGIFNNGGVLVVQDSTIVRNQAVNTTGGGGGLYNNGPAGKATLTRVAFNFNIAQTGGAIFTAGGALTTLNAVTFSSNTPDNTAGPGTVI